MRRISKNMASALTTSACLLLGASALAQSPTSNAGQIEAGFIGNDGAAPTESYDKAYFLQFSPQTAADMVDRLPGFEIRGSSDGERGFGQASLNILINGRRPSAKSSGASEILSRIPADNVVRIEIVNGESLDIPGLSGQVANIIARSGELSGSWRYAARFEEDTQPQLGEAGVNFSLKRGRLEAVGSLGYDPFTFSENGDEAFFDGKGVQTQERTERLSFDQQLPNASLNLTWARENGHVAHLNLSGSQQNRNTTVQEQFIGLIDSGATGASVANVTQDELDYEIGADYGLGLDVLGRDGRLKVIALHRAEDADFISAFRFDDAAPGQIFQLFDQNTVSKEYIGRGEYTWKSASGQDWALSVEGALNTLDSESEFSVNEGAISPDAVRVEEQRYQSNLSRSWAPSARTTLQASLGAEYSIIDVVSADGDAAEFLRPKGSLSASYKLDDSWTVRAQVERRVGQLDFDDFITTVSLAEDTRTQGGNVKPEQTWGLETEIVRQTPTGLSGRFKLFYDRIEDPIEQVLFDDGSQGPANLDSVAEFYGAEANLTWVLDRYIAGLRLTGKFSLYESNIEDPITLRDRSISGETLWERDIGFRYDIPNSDIAFEGELDISESDKIFRIDETVENDFLDEEFELSAIHKDLFGLQVTLKVQNILDFRFERERLRYIGTRTGELFETQLTQRRRGQRFSIELTDTF